MLKIEMGNLATLFKELQMGDLFVDDENELMMCIEDVEDDEGHVLVNCVHLASGETYCEDETTPVRPVNARLIVGA